MKLPSIRQAAQEAARTFARFPSVLVAAILGTATALILVDYEGPAGPTVLFNILLASILGVPLLTALILFAEKHRWTRPRRLGIQAAGILLLVAYAFTVPSDLTHAPAATLVQFLILAVGLHLLVSVAPYTSRGHVNGFWHFNAELFLRMLMAAVYAFVLWVGFSIALAAVDNLFGVDIPEKRYPELWIFLMGVFTTWFFLAGVPEDFEGLERSEAYPKALKVFAQYILFPIVLVYLVILYTYLGKIVVEWDWPQGWTSKLIIGFSATGLFSLLMLHPIAGLTENVWIRKTARWFYVILIPLIVMLFLSVGRRVTEYGLTEGRYLAFALGVWLAIIVVYFTFSRSKSIKFIPASLCVCAFLVSSGPWGALAVPERSQIARLEELLTKDSILVKGKIQKAPVEVSFADARQISSIISYLHTNHGYGGIQSWFTEDLRTDPNVSAVNFKDPAAITKLMGFEYVAYWQQSEGGTVFLTAAPDGITDVTGYQQMVHLTAFLRGRTIEPFRPPKSGCAHRFSVTRDTVWFGFYADGEAVDSLEVNLRPFLDALLTGPSALNGGHHPAEKLTLRTEAGRYKVMICFRVLEAERKQGVITLERVNALAFFTKRKQ